MKHYYKLPDVHVVAKTFWVMLVASIMVFTSNNMGYAMTKDQRILMRSKQIVTFDIADDCNTSNSTDTLSSNASVDERLQYIYTYLRGRGLTPIAAAAVAGNISVESMGGDPTIVERNSKHTGKDLPKNSKDPAGLPVVDGWYGNKTRQPGWGIIQWTPSGKVVGLAKKAGITAPIYEMGAQLDLLLWHMKVTDPSGSNMTTKDKDGKTWYDKFNAMTDISAAVMEFEKQIERAAVPAMGVRTERAKNALEKYESSSTLAYVSSSGDQGSSTLAADQLAQSGCTPTGLSAGDPSDQGLIALIQKYAWPTPNHKPTSEQTLPYQQAIAKAKAAGKYIGGSEGDDCGGFITRLMQDSGRDPNYGGGGNTTVQMAYLKEHTELYKQVSFSEVRFGDIGIWAGKNGHTFMYIGNKVPGFSAPVVEAALRNDEPSSAPRNINSLTYNNSHGAVYFRYIGGTSAL